MKAIRYAIAFGIIGMLSGEVAAQAATVTINQNETHQTITGLGGQHMSGWKYRSGPFYLDVNLDSIGLYDSLIHDLGISLIRYFINLSSQPATPDAYVFDDGSRRNIGYWLKMKDAANRAGFDLKVVTSILSAPVYMKWVKVDQSGDADGMDPQYYDELGRHAVSYLKAAKDSFNLEHYAFSPQNEPYFNEPYSQINYFNNATYTEMFRVVAPAVKTYAPAIKVFFPEHMGRLDWETGPTWDRILGDVNLAPYADIGAVHSYIDGIAPDLGSADGWTALYNKINSYNRPLWMTETSGYDGTTFAGGMDMVKSLFAALKYGKISGWSFLDMVSATSPDCFIHAGAKTHLYFASKQFFRFARPSMVQVTSGATDGDIRVVAFHQRTRNGLGIIMVNLGTTDKTVNIAINGTYTPQNYNVMRYSATDNNTVQTGVAPTGIVLKANSVTSLWAGPDPIGISADGTSIVRSSAATLGRTATRERLAVYDLSGRIVSRQSVRSVSGAIHPAVNTFGACPGVYLVQQKRADGAVVTGARLVR